jgi:hypothetical protein
VKDNIGDKPYGDLFDLPQPAKQIAFGGETYEPERDYVRLNAQMLRTYNVLRDGQWYTLRAIAKITGDPEASISARLRDFRKLKYGGHTIEREYLMDGLHRYRMIKAVT